MRINAPHRRRCNGGDNLARQYVIDDSVGRAAMNDSICSGCPLAASSSDAASEYLGDTASGLQYSIDDPAVEAAPQCSRRSGSPATASSSGAAIDDVAGVRPATPGTQRHRRVRADGSPCGHDNRSRAGGRRPRTLRAQVAQLHTGDVTPRRQPPTLPQSLGIPFRIFDTRNSPVGVSRTVGSGCGGGATSRAAAVCHSACLSATSASGNSASASSTGATRRTCVTGCPARGELRWWHDAGHPAA